MLGDILHIPRNSCDRRFHTSPATSSWLSSQLLPLPAFKMPNHHIVSDADAEKGYEAQQYGYDKERTAHTEEPFVHGAATVGAATGRGGDTHRGLKSRHIQFL